MQRERTYALARRRFVVCTLVAYWVQEPVRLSQSYSTPRPSDFLAFLAI